MDIGKLSSETIEKLIFSKIKAAGKRVLKGAGVGEDCAVLDFGGDFCVVSTDPVTAAANNAGEIAVHISANDVASSGAEPFAMLATILIPPSADLKDVENISDQLIKTADELGISLVGGHTEVTDAVNRIVISTTVFGGTKKPLYSGGGKPGDSLVLTKSAGIEGSVIIARDFLKKAKEVLSESDFLEIEEFERSLSVVAEAKIAKKMGASAMHDITEGGVLGAVFELSAASGTGAVIYEDKIPIRESTKKLCRLFDIDPLKLISSGSMLIAFPGDPHKLIKALASEGITAAAVGELTPEGVYIRGKEGICDIKPPGSDEIYKAILSSQQ